MTEPEITSPKSARVTEVRQLHDRRHRARRGAFVVEGPQAVDGALDAHRVSEVYLDPEAAGRHRGLVARARRAGATVTVVTPDVLRAMAETRQPQGIVAVCPLVTVDATAAFGSSAGLAVILDRAADPGNAGTIIRTADALGAGCVILTEGSVDPHNGKCVRSTAGSLFKVAVASGVTLEAAVTQARAHGMSIVAADGHARMSLGSPEAESLLSGPVAWVFGSEAHGLDPQVRAEVSATMAVPMAGSAESLNLAAAAAICLYETSRAQRRGRRTS